MPTKGLLQLLFVAAIPVAATGCLSSGGGGSSTQETSLPEAGDPPVQSPDGADLGSVALSSQTARPLHRVPLEGIPDELTSPELYAEYHEPDDEGTGKLPIISRDGELYVLTPLLNAEGTSVVLTITDGASHSKAMELTLGALPPPRAGALDELIDAYENLTRAITEGLGKDYPDEWEYWQANSFNNMPEYYVPVVRSWQAVLDPDNDASLVSRSEDAETLELLERIFAERSPASALHALADNIDNGDSMLALSGNLDFIQNNTIQWLDGVGPQSMMLQSTGAAGAGRLEALGLPPIHGAGDLATRLSWCNEVRRGEKNLEILDETVGTYLSSIAFFGSIKSGGAGQKIISKRRREALGWVSNYASGMGTLSGVAQWFLPCFITDLDTELDPADGVMRDEDEYPDQLRLADARGRAESLPVDITREVSDRLIKLVTTSAIDDMVDDIHDLHGDVSEFYQENTADVVNDYGVTPLLDDFLDGLPVGADLVFVWEDIDMIDGAAQRFLEAEVDTFGSAAAPIIEQSNTLEDRIHFRLVTPEAFSRQTSMVRFSTRFEELEAPTQTDTRDVELRYLQLVFDPPRITLEEDSTDPVPFSLTVKNSKLYDAEQPFVDMPLTLEPELGEITYLGLQSGGRLDFEYIPPDDFPAGAIAEIRTEAIIESGIRDPANNPPPRKGMLLVARDVDLFDVVPHNTCLDGGDTHQFSAINPLSGDPVDVDWTASAGSITTDGLFTAPGQTTEVIIEAASTGTPEITSTARVTVNQCDCWWHGRASGNGSASDHGYTGILRHDPDTNHYSRLRLSSHEHSAGLEFNILEPFLAGFTGSVPIKLRGLGNTLGDCQSALCGLGLTISQISTRSAYPEPKPAPNLTLEVTDSTPLSEIYPWIDDPHAVHLAGAISGPVIVDYNGNLTASILGDLHLRFAGTFREPPLGIGGDGMLTCQTINHPPVGYDD